jgi:hypothetical protein
LPAATAFCERPRAHPRHRCNLAGHHPIKPRPDDDKSEATPQQPVSSGLLDDGASSHRPQMLLLIEPIDLDGGK